MKRLIISSILLFLIGTLVCAQEIITLNNKDTIITITEGQVRTLTKMAVDLRETKKENKLLHEIICSDSALVCVKDSIISVQAKQQSETEKYYKRKNKRTKTFGILTSILCFVIGGLLL